MSGFRLGRLFGFTIRVELEWFIVFIVMLLAFALVVFPVAHPGGSQLSYVVLAGVVTLVFYACLILHELSHALAARARGLRVDSITLFIFGGIARMRGEPRSPGDELIITGVGPLTSTALAVIFAGSAVGAVEVGVAPAVVSVMRYVAILNAAVALFNLLPVFPLDGGRLLLALLWKLTGSIDRATRIVIRVSNVISFVMLGIGVWELFTGEVRHGIRVLLVGLILRQVSAGNFRNLALRSALRRVQAMQMMSPVGGMIGPGLTLERAIHDHFRGTGARVFPVADAAGGRQPAGVITQDQIEAIPRDEWPTRSVGDTMTSWSGLANVDPGENMVRVMELLRESANGMVAVRAGGEVQGLITTADVTSWLERARKGEKA
jgi:Zn-dependent protease/CBS domain-containing protein